jgi:hypothetical protein
VHDRNLSNCLTVIRESRLSASLHEMSSTSYSNTHQQGPQTFVVPAALSTGTATPQAQRRTINVHYGPSWIQTDAEQAFTPYSFPQSAGPIENITGVILVDDVRWAGGHNLAGSMPARLTITTTLANDPRRIHKISSLYSVKLILACEYEVYPRDARHLSGNWLASHSNIETNIIGPSWGMRLPKYSLLPGFMVIFRQDRRPLTCNQVEAWLVFCIETGKKIMEYKRNEDTGGTDRFSRSIAISSCANRTVRTGRTKSVTWIRSENHEVQWCGTDRCDCVGLAERLKVVDRLTSCCILMSCLLCFFEKRYFCAAWVASSSLDSQLSWQSLPSKCDFLANLSWERRNHDRVGSRTDSEQALLQSLSSWSSTL